MKVSSYALGLLLLLCLPLPAGAGGSALEEEMAGASWEEEKLDTSRSSFIQGATYLREAGADTGLLVLEYNDETLTYIDVPLETWQAFRRAESLGRFFSEHIKGRYRRHEAEPLWRRYDEPLKEPVQARVQCAFNEDCEPLLVRMLDGAERSIRVAAYAFTRTRIARALVEAHRRGVEVRIKMDREQAAYEGASRLLQYLADNGVPVTRVSVPGRYAAMHNKFIVIDERYVITGSYNYTTTAHVANWENVLCADSPELARQYASAWDGIRSQ
jgi:phosphatidylserine/phosphatidylglycerophosphate/cardiolipin synthase-like enzyme